MTEERPLKMLFLAALGVVLLATAGIYVATTRWGSGESSSFNQPAGGGGEEEIVRNLEGEAQRRIAEEARTQRMLATTAAAKLLEGVSQAKAIASQAKTAATKWEADAPALLGSDEGRRLASDPARVKTFMALQANPSRPTSGSIAQLLERLALLETELERIRSAEHPTLTNETRQQFATQIEEARSEAAAALSALQGDLGALEGLVLAASTLTPSEQSLADVIAVVQREQDERQARETADRLAKVEEEQHKRAMQEAEQRRADELERERKEREDAARAEAERKEKEHWEALAVSADMKAKFEPLLANGTRQPNKRMQWDETHKAAAPVSLGTLQWSGALNDFNKFLELMTRTDNYKNDRCVWPSPTGNADLLKDYRQRFDDLQKLAPIWAASGVLGK